MSREDFAHQLRAQGFAPEERAGGFLVFPYVVPSGSFAERPINLGFQVGDDFPANPPGGPHISPRLLPLHPNDGTPHPFGAVHESPSLGSDWEYWSRPFLNWPQTDRSVRAYLAHVRHLFDTA